VRKTILVVGDSLTWGADPVTKRRHAPEFRWPNALQAGLGAQASVVTEALCGRTTSFDDNAVIEERNAARSMPMLLGSHQPLSLVILMLGTNDLKPHLCGLATGAQAGMRRLVQMVRTHPYIDGDIPQVLIVAPAPRVETSSRPDVTQDAIEQSHLLAPLYQSLAKVENAWFFNAGIACSASHADGVHLDAVQSQNLGTALARYLAPKIDKLSDY